VVPGKDHNQGGQVINEFPLNKIAKTNDCYFDSMDSAEKQYVLGWMFSKGHVFHFKNINHTGFCIRVDEQDKQILYYLKALLSAKRPIIIESKKGRNYARLIIESKQIYDCLIQYGLKPARNMDLEYPANAITNHAAFILGYFEGNGNLMLSGKRKGPTFEVNGPEKMIVAIRDIFARELHLPKVPLTQRRDTHCITYSGIYTIKKLETWLYSWKPAVYLCRKKAQFDELLSKNIQRNLFLNFRCRHCGNQGGVMELNIRLLNKHGFRTYCSLKCSLSFIKNII